MSREQVNIHGDQTTERIGHGHKVTAVAGTAVPLVAVATPTYKALIQAKPGNTGNVFIGGASVPISQAGGIVLVPGQAIELNISDLAKLYVNSAVTGEGVTYIFWQEYRATRP